MERPDGCPECGSDNLTIQEVEVTADLVKTFDQAGKAVDMPRTRLEMRVDAWHCEDCDHDALDKPRIEKEILNEMQKLISRHIAELN